MTIRFRFALAALAAVSACARPPASPPPAAAPAPDPFDVAVTVDDLPFHGPTTATMDRPAIAERLLAAFQRHHLPPVYGFVNGKRVDDQPETEAILRRWIAAGHPLGNHTYSHINLNKVDLPAYFADIEAGERILAKLQPQPAVWKFFRYPYLFEGDTEAKRTAVRNYLRDHAYVTAEVTIEADDWAFNAPFGRCSARGDTAALTMMHQTFVDVHVEEARRMRALTRALVGRDVPHVLLLHVGVADADAIEDLLTAYEKEGARFVSLPVALADPFYALDPGQPAPYGPA
ncbi:MAG TPA: polysaccharide deacetylase family protein, partial [Polyangia bacterium]|nr:polysaccharide deacetylase family protein [Polyangia bacterium]